jgi:hypothetical protein
MAIKIKKLTNEEKTKNVKICIYGNSGTGKSRFAMNGLKRAIVLDIDHGLASVENDELSVIDIPTDPDKPTETTKAYKEAIDYIRENKDDYDTVVIDIMTKFSTILAKAAQNVYGDKWGMEYDLLIRSKLDELLALEMNVIVLYHQETITLENGFVSQTPSITGNKAKQAIPNGFDIIIHTLHSKEEESFIGTFTKSNEYEAKMRFLGMLEEGSTHIGGNSKYQNVQELLDALTKQ